jgi:hypothetical protein
MTMFNGTINVYNKSDGRLSHSYHFDLQGNGVIPARGAVVVYYIWRESQPPEIEHVMPVTYSYNAAVNGYLKDKNGNIIDQYTFTYSDEYLQHLRPIREMPLHHIK